MTMYKILIFLKRRPGLSMAEFQDYYENHHMPLCLKYGQAMKRYVRRYVAHPTNPATGEVREFDYDVVTELWFDEKAQADIVLKYAGQGILPQEIIDDEERLFDRAKSRFVAVTECETALGQV